ncbi:MAG: hypothetical protein AMXMBFR34_12300 [Myxococcaceae bacterium]
MPTKAWPPTLKKKDAKPSTYDDLSVETHGIALLGDHVYFVIYCWDMESDSKMTSVLFRAPVSFDVPAERLSAIDSELVDVIADGDGLLVLENAVGREGYGVLHRLEAPFAKPKKSTPMRFKNANVYTTLVRGDDGALYAAGDTIQRFDGKKWSAMPIATGYALHLEAMATNGKTTVAVGRTGTIVELATGTVKKLVKGNNTSVLFTGVSVAPDGTIAIAGNAGRALQGTCAEMSAVSGTAAKADFTGCASFRGVTHYSACGEASGLYALRGGKLVSILDGLNCFALTATEAHLFAETEEGLLRYDGASFKRLKTKYDAAKGVWTVAPAKGKK